MTIRTRSYLTMLMKWKHLFKTWWCWQQHIDCWIWMETSANFTWVRCNQRQSPPRNVRYQDSKRIKTIADLGSVAKEWTRAAGSNEGVCPVPQSSYLKWQHWCDSVDPVASRLMGSGDHTSAVMALHVWLQKFISRQTLMHHALNTLCFGCLLCCVWRAIWQSMAAMQGCINALSRSIDAHAHETGWCIQQLVSRMNRCSSGQGSGTVSLTRATRSSQSSTSVGRAYQQDASWNWILQCHPWEECLHGQVPWQERPATVSSWQFRSGLQARICGEKCMFNCWNEVDATHSEAEAPFKSLGLVNSFDGYGVLATTSNCLLSPTFDVCSKHMAGIILPLVKPQTSLSYLFMKVMLLIYSI